MGFIALHTHYPCLSTPEIRSSTVSTPDTWILLIFTYSSITLFSLFNIFPRGKVKHYFFNEFFVSDRVWNTHWGIFFVDIKWNELKIIMVKCSNLPFGIFAFLLWSSIMWIGHFGCCVVRSISSKILMCLLYVVYNVL